jgi:hypothetical protein
MDPQKQHLCLKDLGMEEQWIGPRLMLLRSGVILLTNWPDIFELVITARRFGHLEIPLGDLVQAWTSFAHYCCRRCIAVARFE